MGDPQLDLRIGVPRFFLDHRLELLQRLPPLPFFAKGEGQPIANIGKMGGEFERFLVFLRRPLMIVLTSTITWSLPLVIEKSGRFRDPPLSSLATE